MIRVDGEWRAGNVIVLASSGDLGGQVPPQDAATTTSVTPTSEDG